MARQDEVQKRDDLIAGLNVMPVYEDDERNATDLMRACGPGCRIAAGLQGPCHNLQSDPPDKV